LNGRYSLGLDHVGQPAYEFGGEVSLGIDRPLVADSPYELDLSSARRRDVRSDDRSLRFSNSGGTWTTQYIQYSNGVPNVALSVPGLVEDNDDAAFATADLERILRGFDADAGTLPSRLWDAVDVFDPDKLIDFDPFGTAQFANDFFNSGQQIMPPQSANIEPLPELLAAAQQLAAMNRRLVTTDSYDLPVPGSNLLSRLICGADGQPGQAGVDDDQDNTGDPDDIDEVEELGWGGSDDYYPVMNGITAAGAPPTGAQLVPDSATIVDLLKYRVQYERLRLGRPIYSESELSQVVQQLLAPELIAGQRLDLNRPFGDGRDNGDRDDNDNDGFFDEGGEEDIVGDTLDGNDNDSNGQFDELREFGDPYMNGVMDDPLEAGEPFLDLNVNGRWETGEPFIDMLRTNAGGVTNQYDGPLDLLWPELTASGAIAEPIAFDYTNGHGEPIRPEVATAGIPATAVVRNLDSQGRQLYARHLYCLMLLLVDAGYAETPNMPTLGGDNVNMEFMLESIAARRMNNPGAPTGADIELAVRKLTTRRIAQWAINAADFRDADSIMTPFEYDENPWDGWGTRDRNGDLIPLDGDVATNENGSESMNEVAGPSGGPTLATDNMSQVINWAQVANTGNREVSTNLVTGPATIGDQTRGVVWGVERPELLITETLAFHNRRATDENITATAPPSPQISDTPQPGVPPDYDLDQRLKPRGSLFVELYNPWTEVGQQAGEFYGRTKLAANQYSQPGVMLNRLSDIGIEHLGMTAANPYVPQTITKRSPVWRLAVIRDPINGRLGNRVLNLAPSPQYDFTPLGVYREEERIRDQYGANIFAQIGEIDPDGFAFDADRMAERLVYFTTNGDPNRANDDELESSGGQLGEFNFNNATRLAWSLPGIPPAPVMNHLNVWVPPLPWRSDQISGAPATVNAPAAKRYFIARTNRRNTGQPNDVDIEIAPILPGRYAVVGSSGLELISSAPNAPPISTPDGQDTLRYVTPTSRFPDGTQGAQSDGDHLQELITTRRIELWPEMDPEVHQMLVASNGGTEFVRLNGSQPVNVHDAQLAGDPTLPANAAARQIDACVAIPVEDLNISEPVEGYPSHHYQDLYYHFQGTSVQVANLQLNAEGQLEFDVPYDHPLDIDLELVRNGTTQNYRSVHLQRLANPTLPWNPPPIDELGDVDPFHQKHLPVNPYRTIDSQSVDLTAYNGATTIENELPSRSQAYQDTLLLSAGLGNQDRTQLDSFAPLSASEFRFAPDHVVWGVVRVLVSEGVMPWESVATFRERIKNNAAEVENYFSQLEQKRDAPQQDQDDRGWLVNSTRMDQHNRDWGGQRGWSLLRRVLPEDPSSSQPHAPGVFRQRLHMKSLERGGHESMYYKWPSPAEFYSAYPDPATAPEGWVYAKDWQPRLLWNRERPNVRLYLKAGATQPTTHAFDLINVLSRRQFLNQFSPDETRPPQDERGRNDQIGSNPNIKMDQLAFDFLLEQTLGFANESFAPELDRANNLDAIALMGANTPRRGAPEVALTYDGTMRHPVFPPIANVSAPDVEEYEVSPRRPSLLASPQPPAAKAITAADRTFLQNQLTENRQRIMRSTYPWLAWNNRPFVSSEELLQVPGSASSSMLRDYSVINSLTPNPYNGSGLMVDPISGNIVPVPDATRIASQHAPFGHLLNFFATSAAPAQFDLISNPTQVTGAANYYRVLDYVHVPSRFVGTETVLSPDIFNDNPNSSADNISGPADPRYSFQPPFNKVSRQRDPGQVNLNTVTGRREVLANGIAQHWSEVYDGLMHRLRDGNEASVNAQGFPVPQRLSHLGPAWRDVVLSRKGYAQFNADPVDVDNDGDLDPVEKYGNATPPDTFAFGLNPNFPSVFSNPFRSPDAGDLVPLPQMMQMGVDASLLRRHHFAQGDVPPYGAPQVDDNNNGIIDTDLGERLDAPPWGLPNLDDDNNGLTDDVREAGFGGDELAVRPLVQGGMGQLLQDGEQFPFPLFSESANPPYIDGERNPYMFYQPMTRLENLVTNRSNVFAVWITVGYFEVEKAPNWTTNENNVRARFNNDINVYNRVYPDGYMLGREVGSDTGDIQRHRGFYIVDRTEEVGFKPGEDLNVDKMIRLRRRIE
jgi:hypothetical protein